MKQKEGIRYQDRRQNQLEGKYWRGGGVLLNAAVFGLLALFVAPLVFARPAQASDNKIGITLNTSEVVLKRNKNLYQSDVNTITVNGELSGGFNVTLSAKNANLVDSKDSTHIIKPFKSSKTDKVSGLAENQWGYRMGKEGNFSVIDSIKSVIINNDGKNLNGCESANKCTKNIMFAANINPNNLASGEYSTKVTYTITKKPAPAPTVNPTVCKSGNPNNDCQVDLDPNMIPVKYTGTTTNAQWTSLAKPEDSSNQGNWYNYNNKQWANAVTVKDPSKYKNQTRVVAQADILGYWVYIPRYAYEVMRRDGTDKPVPAQNFLISFEKTTTPKRRPDTCPEKGKDYRTQCGLNRDYIKVKPSNAGTWATHPAFTFGKKELNGIWFAKFETTGTTTQPTVLPNEAHISGNYNGMNNQVGNFYSLAKTLGINDPNNVGGGSFTTTQNNHHLAKLSSHMVNNNDWGAASYLSASRYGAGYNKVQINASGEGHTAYGKTYGVTGCGPRSSGDTSSYGGNNAELPPTHADEACGTLGTQSACYSGDLQRAYNGTLGQLASTTNNPTGIYDMAGGGWEYTASSYTTNLSSSSTNYFSQSAHLPYVNNYNFIGFNSCAYQTCGGQALYETNNGSNRGSHQWNGNNSHFVNYLYTWFGRGGDYILGTNAGILFAFNNDGNASSNHAFRVALIPVL